MASSTLKSGRAPVLQDRFEAVANAVDRRLMTGVEQEDASRHEFAFGQTGALGFRLDQAADQVVSRVSAAARDIFP
jgi:hypothetical protein